MDAVDLAYEKSGGQKVLLIGHSAGGWLSRAAMGDGSWSSTELEEIDNKEQRQKPPEIRTSDRIRCLVTLGAPHRPPKDESLCITRGALKYTDMNYPGSFLREEGISYVSIGSAAIRGVQTENHTKDEGYIEFHNQNGNAEKTAYIIYEAVSGNGNSVGDGVIPLHSMLEGAKQIQLDGVFHSFHESTSINPTKRWYGSEEIIDEWLPIVLEEAGLCPNVFENPEIKMKVEISKEINEGANNIVKLCRRVQN